MVSISKTGIRSVEDEAYELSGVFRISTPFGERDVNVKDFSYLDNGNIGIEIMQPTSGKYQHGDFIFQIEYVRDYPFSPPNVWLISPEKFPNVPDDLYSDGRIPYLGSAGWSEIYTSYDVGLMVRSWIYACCKWMHTGEWDGTDDYRGYDQIGENQIQNSSAEEVRVDNVVYVPPDKYQPSFCEKMKAFFIGLARHNGKGWEILDVFVQAGLAALTGPFYGLAKIAVDGVVTWIRKKIDDKISPLPYPVVIS